jgi:CheY-like chemotaxis protein
MAKILVVEDSPDIRVLIRMLLESAGHEVITASDGREGVETARRERPDLVLMDLSLPVLSGWEAAHQIKSAPETGGITVIAVTAHAMQGDRERALAAGCDGFLSKPIDEENFEKEVGAWLDRRKTEAAASPSPAAAPAAPEDSSSSSPRGRILVVDDQPEVVDLLRDDLVVDGHEVVTARSLEEVSRVFTPESQFDLAVVDVMLGQDSGYELTGELIARSEEYLPVLLVTAGTIDRERAFAAGADDFIGKPIESPELRARARSLIRIGRAIREQGRAIKERSEAYDKLAELDRLKSDFLSTVSHELRTPLNTIILLSNVIEREGSAPADKERRLHDSGVIRESAETLLRMINNILDLAKIEAGQRDLYPQNVALRSFLREMADMMEPQARARGISLNLELPADLPETAVLDREKLSRVLINLLSNAVKNTHEGRVVLRASPWQGSIAFEVEDTGAGIPSHLVATAFEPFRQIRTGKGDSGRGSGLGLPISKQLIEVMGGDLIFDTREGRGTRVSFTLPALEEPAAPPPRETSEPVGPAGLDFSGQPRRILVVEDDDASRYGLKSLLESEGYVCVEAPSLAIADQVLAAGAPDIAIVDITLPDGDGAEWAKLRRRKAAVDFPLIALTGMTSDEDRRRIEKSGFCAVLQKPVDIPVLLKALRDCQDPDWLRENVPAYEDSERG